MKRYPQVAKQMKRFNEKYTKMINLLQVAFNCPAPEQQERGSGGLPGSARNYAGTCPTRPVSSSKRRKRAA